MTQPKLPVVQAAAAAHSTTEAQQPYEAQITIGTIVEMAMGEIINIKYS